jgi:hypothetical protein
MGKRTVLKCTYERVVKVFMNGDKKSLCLGFCLLSFAFDSVSRRRAYA